MYGLVIYGFFLESVSVAITEGSTVAPERQAKDGVYIGCYDKVCLKFENDKYIDVPQNATPDSCTASCKRYGFKVAALYNRTECDCSCAQNCLRKPLHDDLCGLPCRGAVDRFCGGYVAASLYRILSTNSSNSQCRKNNETSPRSPGGNDGDYLGCYARGCFQFDYYADHLDNLTTPDSCTATCKENGFPLAGVYNGTKCSCVCEQSLTCLAKPLDNKKCGLPCRSAPTKLCGGYTAVSLYTVHQPVKQNEEFCKPADSNRNQTGHGDDDTPSPSRHPIPRPVLYILIAKLFFVVIIVVVIRTRRRSARHPVSSPQQEASRSEQATLPRTDPVPYEESHTINGSTSHSYNRRRMNSTTNHDPAEGGGADRTETLPGQNFYFTLVAEDGQDQSEGVKDGLSDMAPPSEGTAEYAYADFVDRSTSFCIGTAEKKECDNESESVEDEMVVNALYAMPLPKSSRK